MLGMVDTAVKPCGLNPETFILAAVLWNPRFIREVEYLECNGYLPTILIVECLGERVSTEKTLIGECHT